MLWAGLPYYLGYRLTYSPVRHSLLVIAFLLLGTFPKAQQQTSTSLGINTESPMWQKPKTSGFNAILSPSNPEKVIILSWVPNANNDPVLIAVNTSQDMGTPEDGITYSSGDPIPGGGMVLYTGGGSSVLHENLAPGSLFYYTIYTIDPQGDYVLGSSISLKSGGSTLNPPINLSTQVAGCGEISLEWEAPRDAFYFEDFEGYSDFTTTSFGSWTLLDEDAEPTYGITNFDYPNEYDTMAYILFNPSQVTSIVSPPIGTEYDPYSGSKYAAAIAVPPCDFFGFNLCPNDDWLISPQISLSVDAEVRFQAKSVTDIYGLERFQVLVSTTGTSPADFTKISAGTYLQAPTSWTEFDFDLSAYTGQDVYIAIRCISDDAFIFAVDDFMVGPSSSKKNLAKTTSAGIGTPAKSTNLTSFKPGKVHPDSAQHTASSKPLPTHTALATPPSFGALKTKNAPKSVTAYLIYQNGTLLDSVSAGTLSYTDTLAGYSDNVYYVVARYGSPSSESPPSNLVVANAASGAGSDSLINEGFESSPSGWQAISMLGSTQWTLTTSRAHTGNRSARFIQAKWQYNNDWLISPQVTLGSSGIRELEFWDYFEPQASFWQLTFHRVWISSDYSGSGDPSLATWTLLYNHDYNNAYSWQQRVIDLSAFSGDVYIAFQYDGTSGASWTTYYVDDVIIRSENQCFMAWTGDTDTDWNVGSNWSTGVVPSPSDEVFIPRNRPNYPEMNSAGLAEIKMLNIDIGAYVDVAPTDRMTVHGPILLKGRLNLRSNASGTASLLDNGSIRGTSFIYAEQFIPANRWHYIAARAHPEYTYKYLWLFLLEYEETQGNWGNYIIQTDVLLEPGKGYAVWSNASQTGDTTVHYHRNAITGQVSIDNLSRTPAVVDSLEGFNLIGNPYNSAIDWDAAGVVRNNVGDAVYFWDPDANGGVGGYASYVNGVGIPTGTSGIIPQGQGFFVRVNPGQSSGSIQLDNSTRLHSSLSFFKQKHDSVSSEMLRVRISYNGISDETVVRFLEGASPGLDPAYDAGKLFANVPAVPQVYTFIDTPQLEYLSINALPPLHQAVSVPLGVRTPVADSFLLDMLELSTFAEGVGIFLEDLQTGTLTDLQQTNHYRFLSAGGQEKNRFILHFYPQHIAGLLFYDNAAREGIPGIPLKITSQDAHTIWQGQSGADGSFEVFNLRNGDYSLNADINLPWGGGNATDALLISRHFTGLYVLEGTHLSVADVDASGYINSNDAMLVQRRYVGQTSLFTAGDWYTDTAALNVSGEDSLMWQVAALCMGDVNGSHSLGQKSLPLIQLDPLPILAEITQKKIRIPLISRDAMPLGALSLKLSYPSQMLLIENVTTSLPGDLFWSAENGILRIATFSLTENQKEAGEAILIIEGSLISPLFSETLEMNLLPGSEVADPMGVPYASFAMQYPSGLPLGALETWEIYPNPVAEGQVFLRFNGSEATDMNIRLLDMAGRSLMLRQLPVMEKGQVHRLDIEGLPSGVYQLVLEGSVDEAYQRALHKIIIAR